jgi:ParB family transcriptional regulator, chromosome partitioning protein
MAKQKTGSYLAGRTRNRAEVDFATSDGQIEEIQEEVQSISFSAVPLTPLEMIDSNPFQYRKKMDGKEFEKLEKSMRSDGVTSVILGRYSPENPQRVQIAYGHRRVAVATKLNSEELEEFSGYPILIKELSDTQMRKLAISENWNREDPSIIDTAYAFKSLLETGDYTQEEAADYFGVKRGTFREILDLTKDEQDIQDMISAKDNTLRAARDIRKVSDTEIRTQVIADLLAEKITVTQVPAHVETLEQEKARRLREAKARAAQADQQPIAAISTIPSTPTVPSRNGGGVGELQPAQTNVAVMAAPVQIPSESTRPQHHPLSPMAPSPETYAETQQKSATLTEQSRLRTWCKNVEDYGKRLDKRIRNQEPIPQEEIELIQRLYQLALAQTEKLDG